MEITIPNILGKTRCSQRAAWTARWWANQAASPRQLLLTGNMWRSIWRFELFRQSLFINIITWRREASGKPSPAFTGSRGVPCTGGVVKYVIIDDQQPVMAIIKAMKDCWSMIMHEIDIHCSFHDPTTQGQDCLREAEPCQVRLERPAQSQQGRLPSPLGGATILLANAVWGRLGPRQVRLLESRVPGHEPSVLQSNLPLPMSGAK